jgi:hypothetical protein
VESQTIEVMMKKMQMIQFASIVKVIQVKSMKVIHNLAREEKEGVIHENPNGFKNPSRSQLIAPIDIA